MRIEPEEVLMEFLRAKLTDPRGRHSTNSESFTATEGQTEFNLTPTSGKKVQAIISVKQNSSLLSKWQDYYIDLQNQKIILKEGASSGDEILVNYKEGTTSWIYTDKPREDLSLSSYPRISILVVSGPGERLGNYQADVEHNIHFQIDIWTKEDIGDNSQIFEINGRKYEGNRLAKIIGYQICEQLTNNENEMYPFLYDYQPITSPRDLPMDDAHQAFHTIVECAFKCINIGENI